MSLAQTSALRRRRPPCPQPRRAGRLALAPTRSSNRFPRV